MVLLDKSSLRMNSTRLRLYIPVVCTCTSAGPIGGFRRLKQKIATVFAATEPDGSMKIGLVKKVELVMNHRTRLSSPDAAMEDKSLTSTNPKPFVVSAHLVVVPTNSSRAYTLLQQVYTDPGLRLDIDKKKGIFWTVLNRRNSHRENSVERVCVMCRTNKRVHDQDGLAELLGNLSCEDQPSRKRVRHSLT